MRRQTTTATGGRPVDPDRNAGDRIDIRRGAIPVGVPVEVLNRFDHRWTHGFSVAVSGDEAYQLRRLSDGSVLPAWFPARMIRVDPAA